MAIRFAKGHGTQNDFVLVHDPDGEVVLDDAQVAALCDRRAGIGGDGVLRVVRSAALSSAERAGVPGIGQAEWFMDYRNADGSAAQMCGNGIRVYVAYLLHSGLVGPDEIDKKRTLAIDTRAGTKAVRRIGDRFGADLGPWRVVGGAEAASAGSDAKVHLPGEGVALPGLSIDLGNPHVVVAVPSLDLLADADLTRAPVVEPHPVDGTNVEIVVPGHDGTSRTGHLTMRVHERGVGETRSCGTGAVAAALAARVWGGAGAPDAWVVDVPGGRLEVEVLDGDLDEGSRAVGARLLAGSSVELRGPAVIVATGILDLPLG